jgi:signal transduction histidine kinase
MAVSAATFLVLAASIAERRQAAIELAKAHEGLENKVEEIRKLLVDLEEAVRARDALISIAAHELRTPLSALQLQIHMLDRTLTKGAGEGASIDALRSRLGSVGRPVARLARLIENLLDVSRITAGRLQLEYEELDLSEPVRDVVARFDEELCREHQSVSIRADAPVVGRWDRMRIEQIVTNLMSNAIKYGEAKPIEIIVEGDEDKGRILVRDHGIGIAEGDQARIFERFERVVTGRHAGGFGLGLWIVREIAQALGGTIGVRSELGAGTTFTVELPKRCDSEDPG